MNDGGTAAPGPLDWGLVVLRVVAGVVFFIHGWDKLTGEGGLDGTGQCFAWLGIPAADLAAYVVALEIVGGIALILGLFTRPIGLLFAVEMLVALFQLHRPNGLFAQAGGDELVLLLGGVGLALDLTGAGALAVDALLGDRFGADVGAPRRAQTASRVGRGQRAGRGSARPRSWPRRGDGERATCPSPRRRSGCWRVPFLPSAYS